MLNLWRMKLLLDVANLGTMSAVAQAAHLTRPAVSQHLSQLEREVGFTLFERVPRGVRLTEAGERLAGSARDLLAHVETIEADLASLRGRATGPVRIASFGSFAMSIAPQLIVQLQKSHPELEPSFIELEPTEARRGILSNSVDVAVIDDLVDVQSSAGSLEYIPLAVDEFSIALAPAHPLARFPDQDPTPLDLAELSGENWVINESSGAYYDYIVNACRQAGFNPHVVCSCQSSAAALRFVQSGWAISLVPGLTASTSTEKVVYRRVNPTLSRRITATVAKGRSKRPAIAATLRALQEMTPGGSEAL